MGTTSVRLYECDGPGCDETTPIAPKLQWPDNWPRAMLRTKEGFQEAGAFHAQGCVIAFVTQRAPNLFTVRRNTEFGEGPKDELELVEECTCLDGERGELCAVHGSIK